MMDAMPNSEDPGLPPVTYEQALEAANVVTDWAEHKRNLAEYHRKLATAASRVGLDEAAMEGIALSAATVVIGTSATAAAAAVAGEGVETAALWVAARTCHDLSVQVASSAAVAEVDTPMLAWPLTVVSMMLARTGHALTEQASAITRASSV